MIWKVHHSWHPGWQLRQEKRNISEIWPRDGGASRILLLTPQPLVLCKLNQFLCRLEANNEARWGRGQGDVGGGHNVEDRLQNQAYQEVGESKEESLKVLGFPSSAVSGAFSSLQSSTLCPPPTSPWPRPPLASLLASNLNGNWFNLHNTRGCWVRRRICKALPSQYSFFCSPMGLIWPPILFIIFPPTSPRPPPTLASILTSKLLGNRSYQPLDKRKFLKLRHYFSSPSAPQ